MLSLPKQVLMPEVLNLSSLPTDGVLTDRDICPDERNTAHLPLEGADASFRGVRREPPGFASWEGADGPTIARASSQPVTVS